MKTEIIKPDYLFEVSWEVCNKVGGIYTVVATKSLYLKSEYNRRHIMVGPDVWMDTDSNPDFLEDPTLYRAWKAQAAAEVARAAAEASNTSATAIANEAKASAEAAVGTANDAKAIAEAAIQDVANVANNGLILSKSADNKVSVDWDSNVVFVFNCGSASVLVD